MSARHSALVPSLTPRERERMVGCLNLVASDKPGAVAAAAAALVRQVTRLDLRWEDVIAPPSPVRGRHADWRVVVKACLQSGLLSKWEFRFCEDIPRLPRLSTRQAAVLARIAAEVCVA
jgi:hypothetical protein